jgi:Do/DeqQ family serine protease
LHIKHILLGFLACVISSLISVGIYQRYVFDEAKWLQSLKSDVHAMAERGVLLSPVLRQQFMSSVPSDFITAAEKSRKAVVFIKSNGENSDTDYDDIFQGLNTGSGVLISSDGYIATNYHVVKGASKMDITLNDNRVFEAKLVGADESTDLALLKIPVSGADFLVMGNSDSLMIGEWVLAVGNPFKLQSSVTAGIVSAKARNINILQSQGIESFIQTDAAVNPGNSGGALINTQGFLVGICTAIKSYSGRYEGFSFAIPSNLAAKVLKDLMEYGVVQRGWLGIEIENVDFKISQNLGLPEVAGILISSVSREGGAYDAGLKSGDVVLSVNNTKVRNVSEFMEVVALYRPGDKLKIMYHRAGQKEITTATLRNQLNSEDLIATAHYDIFKQIGLEVRLPDKYERAVISPEGVIVQSVSRGSMAADSRMEPGYVIVRVNNTVIKDPKQLADILENNRGVSVIFEGFYPRIPGEFPYTFVVPE